MHAKAATGRAANRTAGVQRTHHRNRVKSAHHARASRVAEPPVITQRKKRLYRGNSSHGGAYQTRVAAAVSKAITVHGSQTLRTVRPGGGAATDDTGRLLPGGPGLVFPGHAPIVCAALSR
jgi:hypothetical protein